MAWWAETDNGTWTFTNNLLGSSMSTGEKPENGIFLANQDGDLAIGCFDYDQNPGIWTVTVTSGSRHTIGPEDNKTYVKYDIDAGRFKVEFTNFTNIITTSKFSFKQRPAEIGLYNWNTEIYLNKENVSKAEEIIPNYQNKTLTYKEVFTNTDVKFMSNGSHIKEVFINDGTVVWGYPGEWSPSDTYLVIFNELYDSKGIKLYDNDGEIIESKVINGILKLKSTE